MSNEETIYRAWRDAEAYQVPMTVEGEKLAQMRFFAFKRGWEYAQFYAKTGHIFKKDSENE